MKHLKSCLNEGKFNEIKDSISVPYVVLSDEENIVHYCSCSNEPVYDYSKDYVDLGLPSGTLWAKCNVGASDPEEYGDFYAWGEIVVKDYYDWSNYVHGTSSTNITKYNGLDNKNILDSEDDIVYQLTDGVAHMPSTNDFNELIANTSHIITTYNDVNGILYTSNINGNSIFLPYAGYKSGTATYAKYQGRSLGFWTSEVYTGKVCDSMYFAGDGCFYDYRRNGFSIRGVVTFK